jgi:predicted HD superfamily hydrolase involved in NAD metabolism
MKNMDEILEKLKKHLNRKRFVHSVNVMNTSIELAKKYKEDVEKASLAGILHDCAKDIRGEQLLNMCKEFGIERDFVTRIQPELLHGPLGRKIAHRDYGIEDEDILSAIEFHTTGSENMSMLEKIIYIADLIEPKRNFRGVKKLRRLTFRDMDAAIILSLDMIIKNVLKKGKLIHPNTINARNYLIAKLNET